MNRRFLPSTALVTFFTLCSAQAVEYTYVNPAASTISFTYDQMGQQVYGTFGQYEATLDFDTQNPGAARAVLKIRLSSIDAGSSDANTELPKPGWFDMTTHPVGTFESSRITDLGGNRYLFSGNLSLKGQTRPIDVKVALKEQDGIGVFDGELVLKRADFNIGVGEWADSAVSNEINIKFKIVAPQR